MNKFAWLAGTVASSLLASPASAQGSVAGTWNTQVDIGIKIENGVETSMGTRPAVMTLTMKGDSVLGTWTLPADGGSPAVPPNHLHGIRAGNKITLKADPVERNRNLNGEITKVKIIASFALELKGDVLEGTTKTSSADGEFESSERPITAKRSKP